MDKQTDLLLNLSVLYRSTQKYYDRMLQSIQLTYAQLPILIMIYEREGISMVDIAQSGVYDKGTISKSVKNLEKQGFIEIKPSQHDKRNKELYTTDYAKSQMSLVYSIRRDWWQHLIQNIDKNHFDDFIESYEQMAQNAREYAENHQPELHIFEWKKISLSTYPPLISTVLYTGGSNFCSPFDRHPELIYISENLHAIDIGEIMTYLKKRQGIIQAVCIKGGEPFMHPELKNFLPELKALGYKIKIYTNGAFPAEMKEYVEKGWIDMISLDIKGSPSTYAKCIGMSKYNIKPINQTLDFLRRSNVDYECTLHLAKEYHTLKSIKSIANWLKGIKKLIVYNSVEEKNTVAPHLHKIERTKLDTYLAILKATIDDVEEEVEC